jgi:hypothetical protein
MTSETPDTPSTEALTPGTKVTNQHPDILHGEVIDLRQSSALPGFVWVRWENGSVELEQVEDLTLDAERAVRQEAADTSVPEDAGTCPTCHYSTCVGRLSYEDCTGREAADTSGLLHHVRVLVALYEDDMEALPGGDNDPVPAWDDVMRELRKAIADADGSTQEEQP